MNRTFSVGGQSVPVQNPAGATVGQLVRDRDGRLWLEKHGLDPERHRLRQPPGWATDAAHLALLRGYGGCGVRLHTIGGERVEASLADFEAHGIALDRGHGAQVVLPLRYWHAHARLPEGRQLALGLAS